MRYGIISDIHSNLEALTAVVDALADTDALVCVGDIVGYGPDPNECCEFVRERVMATVLGNHDAAVAGLMPLDWFNSYARSAVLWTKEQLSDENLRFLRALGLVRESEHFVMVHASLDDPRRFDYITSPWEASPTFAEMGTHSLCFVGHTHHAEYYALEEGRVGADRINMAAGGTIDLKPGFQYIINVGSVGQPRDGNPRASCGIYDTEKRFVQILRVEYPVAVVQSRMRGAGLPDILWDRLAYGL